MALQNRSAKAHISNTNFNVHIVGYEFHKPSNAPEFYKIAAVDPLTQRTMQIRIRDNAYADTQIDILCDAAGCQVGDGIEDILKKLIQQKLPVAIVWDSKFPGNADLERPAPVETQA